VFGELLSEFRRQEADVRKGRVREKLAANPAKKPPPGKRKDCRVAKRGQGGRKEGGYRSVKGMGMIKKLLSPGKKD